MNKKLVWLLFAIVLLSGCGTMPETPDGVRQVWKEHPDSSYYPRIQFDVALPLARSVQFVKSKAAECLNITVQKTSRGSNGAIVYYNITLKSFVTITDKKAEIYVTETLPGNFGAEQNIIQAVADFYPVSSTKTKVVIYHLSYNPSALIAKGIESWAAGKDIGCPNLT